MKKLLLTIGVSAATIAPLATVIACSDETVAVIYEEYDLFIYTGKTENINEFRAAADKYEELYKEDYGQEISIGIVAPGDGMDEGETLDTLMSRENRPDIITSFGMGDVWDYAKNGDLLEIDLENDDDLYWAKDTQELHAGINNLMLDDLTLPVRVNNYGDGVQYGLSMSYEASGPALNLKTLGQLYPISGKTDEEAGMEKYNEILTNGVTWTDFQAMKSLIMSDTSDSVTNIFANATKESDASNMAGRHMVNDWLSQRYLHGGGRWDGYGNTYLSYEKGDAFTSGNSKNPIEANGVNLDKVVASLYGEYYGADIHNAGKQDITLEDAFTAFRDGEALFTYGTTAMYQDIAGDDESILTADQIVPFPMPLQTVGGTYGEAGTDKYSDSPVSHGAIWHIVNNEDNDNDDDGKDIDKTKLSKDFLAYISVGDFIRESGVASFDGEGAKLFYNSENSQLVNPYAVKYTDEISGQNLVSRIIMSQIRGQQWDGSSEQGSGDYKAIVTIWSNGGLGNWSEQVATRMLEQVGTENYTGTMSEVDWDKYKTRFI